MVLIMGEQVCEGQGDERRVMLDDTCIHRLAVSGQPGGRSLGYVAATIITVWREMSAGVASHVRCYAVVYFLVSSRSTAFLP